MKSFKKKISIRKNTKSKDINFSLKTGEITAIVGFSGAGKSSILDLLIGLYEPTSGDIFVDGKNLNELKWNKGFYRKDIGWRVIKNENH